MTTEEAHKHLTDWLESMFDFSFYPSKILFRRSYPEFEKEEAQALRVLLNDFTERKAVEREIRGVS